MVSPATILHADLDAFYASGARAELTLAIDAHDPHHPTDPSTDGGARPLLWKRCYRWPRTEADVCFTTYAASDHSTSSSSSSYSPSSGYSSYSSSGSSSNDTPPPPPPESPALDAGQAWPSDVAACDIDCQQTVDLDVHRLCVGIEESIASTAGFFQQGGKEALIDPYPST